MNNLAHNITLKILGQANHNLKYTINMKGENLY